MRVQQTSSLLTRFSRIACSAVLAVSSVGCAAQSRYSTEALHAMAPNAGIVDVCMKLPMVTEYYDVVAAYDEDTRTVVTDRDWNKFTAFAAKEAEFIYRYEPSLPDETTEWFPDPYKKFSCRAEPSSKEAPVPVDLQPIRMTPVMRDAMVTILTDERLRVSLVENNESASLAAKRFLGQWTPAGLGPRAVYSPEAVEDVGQMLRDAIRNGVPTVKNGSNEAISILDTQHMQVVGGLAAGAGISVVPGGWLVSTALQASPNGPKPTREFAVGQALGEMGGGALQMFIGGGGTIGGIGLSGSGGGALLGVPMCTAGIALAANGATTFLHGATTLVVTICHWDDLPKAADAQPLAAVAPKDAAPSAPPPQSGGAPPVTTPPASPPPVKPAAAPVQAAKPVPAKPAPVPVKPAAPVKPAPKPPKSTDPTVVTIRSSGNKTIARKRLQEGQEPCDTTLTVRTDDAGKVVSMEVSTTVKAAPAELKPYNQGKGHHPVAKRAMEGAPNYDANKALAVPKAELERLDIKHGKITGEQLKAYKEFAKNNLPLTWEAIARIEADVLIKSGMKPDMAQATVAKAIQALKQSNVPGPVRIPWGK